jgi:UDPglucose 6-dehydrogenase
MKIGIVGLGIVGSAGQYGFQKLGHDVKIHDIRLNTKLEDILDTEICFICVPTPSKEDHSCDTSIVETVIDNIINLGYNGIIAIKSTVQPGTTRKLIDKYNTPICFVPEFLRERCANVDFIENHDVCIIGTQNKDIFNLLKKCHGHYPKKFVQISETEAELCKYFNNIYNATLVTFANSFYEVCKSLDANYTNVKNAIVLRDHITDIYLDCNENFRAFSGPCLPKDCKAINYFCKANSIDVKFFETLLTENDRYKKTVFEGMRE